MQGIEVLKIMDDKEWLSWDNIELRRLMKSQYDHLTLTETALSQSITTNKICEQSLFESEIMTMAYRKDYGELIKVNSKQKRKIKRNRWIAVGAGVLGLMVGVYIAK